MSIRFLKVLLAFTLLPPLCPAQSIERKSSDIIPTKLDTMYVKGLKFLSSTQQANGSWNDTSNNSAGIVGLATLAFLAHGEDPNHGPYATNIKRSIDFLITTQQQSNGYIGTSMYNHGFATLALAESYGSVKDDRLEGALTKAVELILSSQAQNPKNGWRYKPDSKDADTTVSGCQIVALLAARNAGIPVPDKAIEKGLAYLSSCRNSAGSYGYTTKGGGSRTLTAIGSLCFSLAKQKDSKSYKKSLAFLKKDLERRDSHYIFYFGYYMSQALFQADEETWKEWNTLNTRFLSVSQQQNGSWLGRRGTTYSTSTALLSLALNYRFLPIYEK